MKFHSQWVHEQAAPLIWPLFKSNLHLNDTAGYFPTTSYQVPLDHLVTFLSKGTVLSNKFNSLEDFQDYTNLSQY